MIQMNIKNSTVRGTIFRDVCMSRRENCCDTINISIKTVGQSTAQEGGSTFLGDSQSGFNFIN